MSNQKKRVVIETNEMDLQSIQKSERTKTELENKGYTLVNERATPFRSWLTYVLK